MIDEAGLRLPPNSSQNRSSTVVAMMLSLVEMLGCRSVGVNASMLLW